MVLTSVYNANSASDLQTTDSWLGRGVDAIQLHGGTANWSDWLSSVSWEASQFQGDGSLFSGGSTNIIWSIGLIPSGANLADAAAGKYDDQYVAMAKALLAASGSQDKIIINLGWEFNTQGWNQWGAVGQAANYAEAYRQFVDAARSVSDKFVFQWTPNVGDNGMNPADAYPGDDYVDIIGSDFYYNTQWDSKDAQTAFNYIVSEPYGLQWAQDFAAAHGKETAIGEWGLNSDNADFVKLVAQWAADHNMVYQNYWDSNDAFQGSLSDGQYADAAAAFKAIYGAAATATTTTTTTGSAAATAASSTASTALDYTPNAGINGATTGNDVLYGSATNYDLRGGDGDDTYYITAANQKVTEYYNDHHGGNDTVIASINYTLTANVENLTLAGTADLHGTGNSGNNVLTGNSGNNTLTGGGGNDKFYGGDGNDILIGGSGNDLMYGGAGNDKMIGNGGADVMVGGDGNDTYYIDNDQQRIVEYYSNGNGGVDTVYSSISYKLGDFLENLHLTGSDNLNATGNSLNNAIYGNDGNNVINGGTGNDNFWGGAGSDTFVVDFMSGKKAIHDFHAGDTLDISAYMSAGKAPKITSDGTNTMLTWDSKDSIQLIGITPDHLVATSTGFIYG